MTSVPTVPLKTCATFEQHNLMDVPYPGPAEGFDVILCRNVLMYFTDHAADGVLKRMASRLKPGGVLFLGGAEPLLRVIPGLRLDSSRDIFFYRAEEPKGAPGSTRSRLPTPVPLLGVRWPVSRSSPSPVPFPMPVLAASALLAGEAPRADAATVAEGEALFESLLNGPARGDVEAELRRALYLAPGLAAARYCLAMVLEARGDFAGAVLEFERALSAVERGRESETGFLIGGRRLAEACILALRRLRRG